MKEYPFLDPPDAVAVSVALEPLPTVAPGTVTVGSGFTVIAAELELIVGVGVEPVVTPMSTKVK